MNVVFARGLLDMSLIHNWTWHMCTLQSSCCVSYAAFYHNICISGVHFCSYNPCGLHVDVVRYADDHVHVTGSYSLSMDIGNMSQITGVIRAKPVSMHREL